MTRGILLWLLTGLFVLGAVISVPAWNALAVSQGRMDDLVSLSGAPKQISVVGVEQAHMSGQLALYAEENGWPIEVLAGDHEGPRLHEVIFYFGPQMLDQIPGARDLCGDACTPEGEEVLSVVRVIDMRRFGPHYMAQFVNLDAFAVDGTVDGARFDCVMQAIWDATQDPLATGPVCAEHATVPVHSTRARVTLNLFQFP